MKLTSTKVWLGQHLYRSFVTYEIYRPVLLVRFAPRAKVMQIGQRNDMDGASISTRTSANEDWFKKYKPKPEEKGMITLHTDHDPKEEVFVIEVTEKNGQPSAELTEGKIKTLAIAAQLMPDKTIVYTQEYWLEDGRHIQYASNETPKQALVAKNQFPEKDPQKRHSWPFGREAAEEKAMEMVAGLTKE